MSVSPRARAFLTGAGAGASDPQTGRMGNLAGQPLAPRYRFGDFELDCASFTLTCAGRKRAVAPKVFDVLRYLIENPSRLLTKQELLDSVWAGQCVEEVAVPWAISHARRALRQRCSRKTPIETVYGRGYRFMAEVECVTPARALPPPALAHAFPTGEYARLTEMARTAGLAAARAGAHEDAARFYRWALEAQAHDTRATARARADLLLALARAQARAGVGGELRHTVTRLIDLSARHGFRDLLAEAAAALPDANASTGGMPRHPGGAVQAALDAFPDAAADPVPEAQ